MLLQDEQYVEVALTSTEPCRNPDYTNAAKTSPDRR